VDEDDAAGQDDRRVVRIEDLVVAEGVGHVADQVERQAQDGAVAVAEVLDGDLEAVAVLHEDAARRDVGETDAMGEKEGGSRVVGERGERAEEVSFGLLVEALVVEVVEPGEALGEGHAGVEEGDMAREAGWLERRRSYSRSP